MRSRGEPSRAQGRTGASPHETRIFVVASRSLFRHALAGTLVAVVRALRSIAPREGKHAPEGVTAGRARRADRRARLRADDRGQRDDAQEQPLYRRAVLARPLGELLGRPAQARQREHREDHDPEHRRDAQLRGDGSPERHRHPALRVDGGQPGRAARRERMAGPHRGREVQPPGNGFHAQRVTAHDRRRVRGHAHRRLHAGLLSALAGQRQPPPLGHG